MAAAGLIGQSEPCLLHTVKIRSWNEGLSVGDVQLPQKPEEPAGGREWREAGRATAANWSVRFRTLSALLFVGEEDLVEWLGDTVLEAVAGIADKGLKAYVEGLWSPNYVFY